VLLIIFVFISVEFFADGLKIRCLDILARRCTLFKRCWNNKVAFLLRFHYIRQFYDCHNRALLISRTPLILLRHIRVFELSLIIYAVSHY